MTDIEQQFEVWWNSYPQEKSTERDRKANALAAWLAAWASATAQERESCVWIALDHQETGESGCKTARDIAAALRTPTEPEKRPL